MAKEKSIPCIMHIPLTYPDGTNVTEEAINTFLEILDRQFGGCSPLGVIPGRWMGVVEPMLRVEVAMPKKEIPRFEEIARKIGRATKQRVMYVVINYQADVRFLDIVDEDDDVQSEAVGGR